MMTHKIISNSLFRILRCNLINKKITSSRSFIQNQNHNLKVRVLPALTDNYMYLLIDNNKKTGLAVDPVEPDVVLNCANEENVTLKGILTTHHHFDHAGGNAALCQKIKDLPVYGGDDRIEALTVKVRHNETFQIDDIKIKCLHTPCHTSGHVCYFIDSDKPICFTGDTLFIAGCGKFFEGSGEEMYKSLSILRKLPLNTKIYCGHEYTVSNLKFAQLVEPFNPAVIERLNKSLKSIEIKEPTVPSTIEDELKFNPFLRENIEAVQRFTGHSNPAMILNSLRDVKDKFSRSSKQKIEV